MGALFDLLKDIPLSAVLKEKIATFESENAALKTEIAILKDDKRKLQAENKRLKHEIEKLTHTYTPSEIEVKILTRIAKRQDCNSAELLAGYLRTDLTRVEY